VAKRALAHYGDEKLVAYLESTKLGNDPALLNAFARIGATLAEDGIIGRTDGGSTAFSPAEARQQIGDLQADGQFVKAYMDARAPGHAEAVQRMQALYAQAYPEPPKA